MIIMEIKIIIGANYGDEGKGLAADYFAGQAKGEILGVLTNGTAQRGHTVTLTDGRTHVFHHFSSGTFQGADTYICKNFTVNPMIFVKELVELMFKSNRFYVHPECKVVTPFDMLRNLQERRISGLHNTCGAGYWNTLERYDSDIEPLIFGEIIKMDPIQLEYSLNQIYKYHFTEYSPLLTDIDIKGLIQHFIDDIITMARWVEIANDNILNKYGTIIFENGQGLLIGQQNSYANWDFCTPSDTGVYIPMRIIENNHLLAHDIEVCYVSRTYLTRHGDGPLDHMCSSQEINPEIYDFTNIPNINQGRLRYGKLDTQELRKRIDADFGQTALKTRHYTKSIMLTHWNEYELDSLDDLSDGRIYISKGKTREQVEENK